MRGSALEVSGRSHWNVVSTAGRAGEDEHLDSCAGDDVDCEERASAAVEISVTTRTSWTGSARRRDLKRPRAYAEELANPSCRRIPE
jgi:hypothetical protein